VEQLAAALPQLEILELIGQGGMGCVFKARQPKLDRLVAVKVLPQGYQVDPAFAGRFEREARALAALGHPNIVTIHDFGQSGGFYYLLMEYVDGVNLRQLMRSRKLSAREALAVVPPLCEALQFAHDRGIVHRDIKPENLLLDKSGRIKIADFGIAKMLGGETPEDSEAIAGTPRYMAPEQKFATETDHRSDIYSLGVVLYEMLTGELPSSRIEPPSRRVQIDVRLDEIVLKALEKTPELRFQSATDLRTKVETVMKEEPPSDQPSDAKFRRVIGRSKAYLSTPETLSTLTGQVFPFRNAGEIVLDEQHLTVVGSQKTWSIPLGAIRAVSLGNDSRTVNLFKVEWIRLVFQVDGKPETLFVSPFEGSGIWADKIRGQVTRLTGTSPTSSAMVPGEVPSSPLLFGVRFGLTLAVLFLLVWGILWFWRREVETAQGTLFSPAFGVPELLIVVVLSGLAFLAFLPRGTKNRSSSKTPERPPVGLLRRLACGLVGFLIPILPMVVYSLGVSQKARLDTEFQSRKMDLYQKEIDFTRDLEIANERMTSALEDARKVRDAQIEIAASPERANLRAEYETRMGKVTAWIESLMGQQQAARLNLDRIFQQKTDLERHQPGVSPTLGWGATLVALILLVTLYLMGQATIPLRIPATTFLIGLGVSFGTLRMVQSEQEVNHHQIVQAVQKSVGELPGEPGRYGPTYATWNSVFSAGHPTRSYTASIGIQPRCRMTVRTFVKLGTTTTEIPDACFLMNWGQPAQATSLSARWEPKLNSLGEPVLVLSGSGNQRPTKEVMIPGISGIPAQNAAKLVWNAVNPDPMNLTTYQQPSIDFYMDGPPIPMRGSSGNQYPGNGLRFPILMGHDPANPGVRVEILVEWRVKPLESSASHREEFIEWDLPGTRDPLANLPVQDVIPNHLVTMISSGAGNGGSTSGSSAPDGVSQFIWKVTGSSQRRVNIRWANQTLSRWMKRESSDGPFALTIQARAISRESSGGPETQIQLELQTGRENAPETKAWILPGVTRITSSPLWEKGPKTIWQYQPLELLPSAQGGLFLELSDRDDPPKPVTTASRNQPVTDKDLEVLPTGSQTEATMHRSSWLIRSRAQRFATIRYRDRAFKVALSQHPDSPRFEATLTAVQQFPSPNEMRIVWLIQRPGDYEIRETWVFPSMEIDHFKSAQGEFPNPTSPMELLKGGKGSLMLSLTEDDPSLKPLASTLRISHAPTTHPNPKPLDPKEIKAEENTISVFKIPSSGSTRDISWTVTSQWPATLRVRHKFPKGDGNTWGLPLIKDPLTGRFTATLRAEIFPLPADLAGIQKIHWVIQAPEEQEKKRIWKLPAREADTLEIAGAPERTFGINQPIDILKGTKGQVTLELNLPGNLPKPPAHGNPTSSPEWISAQASLEAYLKKGGQGEMTLVRNAGKPITGSSKARGGFSVDPTPATLALVASATEEVLGEVSQPQAWRKKEKGPSYLHLVFEPPLPITTSIPLDSKLQVIQAREILIPLPESQIPREILVCDNEKVRALRGFQPRWIEALIAGEEFQLKHLPAYQNLGAPWIAQPRVIPGSSR